MEVNPLLRAGFLLAALVSGCGGGSDAAGPTWNGTPTSSTETSLQMAPKLGAAAGDTGSALRPLARSPFHLANRFSNAQKYSYKLGAGSYGEASVSLATLNSPAYAGYRIFSQVSLDGFVPATVYEKGAVEAYAYRLVTGSPFDEAALGQQAAAGYLVMGSLSPPSGGIGVLYGMPLAGGTAGTTYGYLRVPYDVSANLPSSELTARLNSAGAQGGCWIETAAMLLRRSRPSAGVCVYEILPVASTMLAWVDQLNAQGARGFFLAYREGRREIYVKDTLQNSVFGYYVLDTPEALSVPLTERANAFVDLLNREGQKGGRLFTVFTEGGVRKTIFRMSENCIGAPCD